MSAYLGPFGAFMASVTWAFASTRYAEVARDVGGIRVGLVRATFASVLWLLALLVLDGPSALREVSGLQLLCLCGSITCSYALGDRIFFSAAHRIGVPSALAIATIYPLWAALYGVVLRGEPLGLARCIGVVLCLIGVSAVLRLSQAGSEATLHESGTAWAGVGLALLTSLFWAGNTVFLKLASDGLSLVQANAVRFPCGALLLFAQLLALRTWGQPGSASAGVSFPIVARRLSSALLLDAGIGSVCFVYGIAHTDLALGATLSSLSPLVALPIAVVLGSERVSVAKVVAVCTTLLGVVLLVGSA